MQARDREIETEVAIVGAGPVGLCLALELGSRGVDCVVLERRSADDPTFPTANHIAVRTMEHLRRHGLAGAVGGAFGSDRGDWVAVTYLGGPEVARVDDALADSTARSDSPEREVWAPKPCFDPILEGAAAAMDGVELRRGQEVVSVRDEGPAVWCLARGSGGEMLRVRAAYAVGCDGAASDVRRRCGIGMLGPPPLPVRVHSAYFRSRRVAKLVPRGAVQVSILGTPSGPTPTAVGAGVMVAVGFTLLRTRPDCDPSPFERAARECGAPLRVEAIPAAGVLFDRTFTLVRPDGVVAWRGDEVPADSVAILDRVRGA